MCINWHRILVASHISRTSLTNHREPLENAISTLFPRTCGGNVSYSVKTIKPARTPSVSRHVPSGSLWSVNHSVSCSVQDSSYFVPPHPQKSSYSRQTLLRQCYLNNTLSPSASATVSARTFLSAHAIGCSFLYFTCRRLCDVLQHSSNCLCVAL
jgi:hypothetical protein